MPTLPGVDGLGITFTTLPQTQISSKLGSEAVLDIDLALINRDLVTLTFIELPILLVHRS